MTDPPTSTPSPERSSPDGTLPASPATWSWPREPEVDLRPTFATPPIPPPTPTRRQWRIAGILFVLTLLSTFVMGGPVYALAVMFMLTTHELGHYIQSRRYRVAASLPFFIPMPISPIGTMGAVIIMRERIAHTKALFDIGISGPLAGLVPSLAFTVIGVSQATIAPIPTDRATLAFGEPLLFQWIAHAFHGPIPDGQSLWLGPFGMAGWVGIFITALNLLPIGQLDGGHILYALLGRRAHTVAMGLLGAAVVAVIVSGNWGWSLAIGLLMLMGPKHPPTLDDSVPLDPGRRILGWATLAFVIIGFTPTPMWFEGM